MGVGAQVPAATEVLFDADGTAVAELPAEVEARAVIEARFLSMRLHAEFIGLKVVPCRGAWVGAIFDPLFNIFPEGQLPQAPRGVPSRWTCRRQRACWWYAHSCVRSSDSPRPEDGPDLRDRRRLAEQRYHAGMLPPAAPLPSCTSFLSSAAQGCGGAGTRQVIADVFGCDVFTMASPGGAPLGAAYRALHAVKSAEAGSYVPYGEVRRPRSEGAARPVTS